MGKKLMVRYASMSAGKSLQLLGIAFDFRERGKEVLLFTAAIDNRTKVGEISSRIGVSQAAQTFDKDTDFLRLLTPLKGISAVLIDECQFCTEDHARQLHIAAARLNLTIMCFLLRTDFQGMPFTGSAALMSLADDIQEIKAICSCERKSTMNIRIDDQGNRVKYGEQILIGGNSRYRAVCSRCFYEDWR